MNPLTKAPLTGTVEADETYVCGKYDKRSKRAHYDKEPVFGMVERDGKARTTMVPVSQSLKVPKDKFEAVMRALLHTSSMPATAITDKRLRKADAKKPGPKKRG